MSSQGGYIQQLFDAKAVSGTTTYYTDKFSMLKGSLFSLHMIATETQATLGGTYTLWESNIPNADPTADTDWVQNTDVTFTAVASGVTQLLTVGNAAARWYRVKYVNATGEGTLDIWLHAGKGA